MAADATASSEEGGGIDAGQARAPSLGADRGDRELAGKAAAEQEAEQKAALEAEASREAALHQLSSIGAGKQGPQQDAPEPVQVITVAPQEPEKSMTAPALSGVAEIDRLSAQFGQIGDFNNMLAQCGVSRDFQNPSPVDVGNFPSVATNFGIENQQAKEAAL